MADVLQHLLAVDEVETAILERHGHAVEDLEACVRADALGGFGRSRDIDPDPLHVRIPATEEIDRSAGAATQVEHAPPSLEGPADLPIGIAVGERLARVIAGDDIPEELLEVATGQPEERSPLAA